MTLDLHDLTADWHGTSGEINARLIVGRDGSELLQLRVDLGVLQMTPEGRPDGGDFRGAPTVLAHFQRNPEGAADAAEWTELERELYQVNYRRLALTALMDDALRAGDEPNACRHLERALRDIESCLQMVKLLCAWHDDPAGQPALRAALLFNRGRLRVQRELLRGLHDEAVEQAVRGAAHLETALRECGLDDEQCESEPGVVFLREWGRRLRLEHDVERTLSEQLDDAVENEDFEEAARLKEELRRRQSPPIDEPA